LVAASPLALALWCGGCNVGCSDIELTAVEVHVDTDDRSDLERVTVQPGKHDEYECSGAASGDYPYECGELGLGKYVVRLYTKSGQVFTQEVAVSGDECHADQPPEQVTFVIRDGSAAKQ
jgi:hypothetical protein